MTRKRKIRLPRRTPSYPAEAPHSGLETRLADALADCLEALRTGADVERVLADHPDERGELESLLRVADLVTLFADDTRSKTPDAEPQSLRLPGPSPDQNDPPARLDSTSAATLS